MAVSGYAVVDVETTGLFPGKHDRIVEIAVVRVDRDGGVVDDWSTLVNCNRDLGAQHIHSIRAADVREAPAFDDIAGELTDRLAGRVLVAHNLTFDARFIRSEYARLGAQVPVEREFGLCTMSLAGRYLDGTARSLAACCAAAGIDQGQAHSALHDARACAGLLAAFIEEIGRPEPWLDLLRNAGRFDWPPLPRGSGRIRQRSSAAIRRPSFLERMIDRLPRITHVPRADEYLAMLDRALLDRHISMSEQDALLELAGSLGLTAADATELHRRYLVALARAAWQDKVVTDDEHKDLVNVADLLGVGRQHVDIALTEARADDSESPRNLGQFCLQVGDLVAFTGQMTKPREDWESLTTGLGLRVTSGTVTRATRLLVAADPDSQSGKAGRARHYGIPIVGEEAFANLLTRLSAVHRNVEHGE